MKNENHQTDPHRLWIQETVASYGPTLQRYATKLCGDPESARDAVQDTFSRLAKQQEAKISGHLRAWLFTVCRSRVIDTQRKEQRMTPVDDIQAIAEGQPAPATQSSPRQTTEQTDLHTSILGLIEQLPRTQSEVVRLKFQNELSYKEIAEITQHSVSHVGVLLHSALKSLRQQSAHLR